MDRKPHRQDGNSRWGRPGVILLITLVILVILSTLAYTLTVRVAARRHRDQYLIDSSIARHACASGMRYALASFGTTSFELISRPNEPDFSDVFALSEPQYQKLLLQMDRYLATKAISDPNSRESATKKATAKQSKARLKDANDVNDAEPNEGALDEGKTTEIPGPYGPPWPLVTEPIEFEIGPATVTIEVEDENAKYPLGWAMLADDKLRDEAGAGWNVLLRVDGVHGLGDRGTEQGPGGHRRDQAVPNGIQAGDGRQAEVPANLRGRIAAPLPAVRLPGGRSPRNPSPPRSSSRSRTRSSPVCSTVPC